MSSDFEKFPDPPPQCSIALEREKDRVCLSVMPRMQFPQTLAYIAGGFGYIWNAGVIGMMAFGVWFCWMFVTDVMKGAQGAPNGWEILPFVGFFILWFGVLVFFLVIGIRMQGAFSGHFPLLGWRLVLERGEWSSTRFTMGRANTRRLNTIDIHNISIDTRRRVVAEVPRRRVILTAPLTDYDAGWLSDSLRQALGRGVKAAASMFPFVPSGDLSNSPGNRLAYRLPSDRTERAGQIGCYMFTLFWNLVVGIFLAVLLSGSVKGADRMMMGLILIPFVLVGIVSLIACIHQILAAVGVATTIVEISDHPLGDTQPYQLHVLQHGPLRVNSLRVLLACDEVATYVEGSSTRTESRRVYEHQLFRRDGLRIEKAFPFEADLDVELPRACMHSFDAGDNSLRWKIVVKGDVPNWPDFERGFPIIVYPTSKESASNP